MARYIDADLLKLQIERGAEMTERGIRLLDLSQQPTADVVPVVRCKDCQHCYYTPEGRSGDVILPERYQCEKMLKRYREDCDSAFSNYVTPEWFCADGERKEEK